MRCLFIFFTYVFFGAGFLSGQSKFEVPPKQFAGAWIVEKAIYHPPEGAPDEMVKEKLPDQEYLFRKGKKQALYRYFSDPKKTEYGITILDVSKTTLTFRGWSDHPVEKTIITLGENDTAVVQEIYAKGCYTLHLKRQKMAKQADPAGTAEPTTSSDKPQPEAEGRSR